MGVVRLTYVVADSLTVTYFAEFVDGLKLLTRPKFGFMAGSVVGMLKLLVTKLGIAIRPILAYRVIASPRSQL